MKTNHLNHFVFFVTALSLATLACNGFLPLPNEQQTSPTSPSAQQEPTLSAAQQGFPDRPALPNTSGIEGVQTFPDKTEYHTHIQSVPDPIGDLPPAFGQHFPAWQNCGIYTEPIEVGTALHSMEHGAVWVTYRPDLSADKLSALQDLVRGNDFVLLSPYPAQTADVVLSAWTIQLVIESFPDERAQAFIEHYANGPQNPEPGAPCSGAIGEPLP